MPQTRITHYESEAYNLPAGVIHYVGPPCTGISSLSASADIQSAIDMVCPQAGYLFLPLEVSESSLADYLALHPDIRLQDKRLITDMAGTGMLYAPSSVCRTTLATRISADEDDGYTFFEADITDCPADELAETIVQYAMQLYRLERGEEHRQSTGCIPEDGCMPRMRQCKAPRKSTAPRGLLRRIADAMPALLHDDMCKSSAREVYMSAAEERAQETEAGAGTCEEAAPCMDTDGLLKELQRRLAAIPQSDGINILLQRQFEDFFRTLETLAPRPLSPLQIDEKLHILLPGYDREIQMLPVWKAVYILFLRHEEGIVLNRMPDYRDEFACIYKSFAAGEPAGIEATINEVTTPGSDIFRQYKSKINSAFRQVLAEDIAQHYIIAGSRNAPYKIQLPRDKVIINCAIGVAR